MLHRTALSVLLLPAAWAAMQAQITVDPMAPVALCGSPTLNVAFTAAGTYNAGNLFTMELSDATGSFAAPTAIGSIAGTGSGSISCTFPAGITGWSGQAIRVVASDPAETGDPYMLPITTVVPPPPGQNAVVTFCSDNAPIDLTAYMAGSPQTGWTWNGPLGPFNGIFDPATDPPGVYPYETPATAPCAGSTGSLAITVTPAPDPGTSSTITICADAAPFSMLSVLGGTPEVGGMWTSPGGSPHPNVFIPGTHPAGCYTYTAPGMPPCWNASSMLCITVTPAMHAGDNAVVNACSTDAPFALFGALNGSPQPGGAWLSPFNDPFNGQFVPGTSAPGCYRYVIAGSGSCVADTAQVCVSVAPAPDAGTNASLNWCLSSGVLDLFAQLGGTPAPGGTWIDTNGTGQLTGNILNAGAVAVGTYAFEYVVGGPSCPDATATVTVTISSCFTGPGIPNYPTE